jgi:allophanate hydrolase
MTMPHDITAMRRAYSSGATTPETVLKAVYRQIAQHGERPAWIHLVPEEEALARLKLAPRGPLWGIPFAVKDNIDVAGLPTTAACPDFAYTPDRSAVAVERLVEAGAVLLGKTNLDQFATGLVGTRTPYGICSSVFNPDYISGGSSSGSAVVVALGLVPFALGTDTAGSGRVPAAFNNIVGVKPTKGLVSAQGVVPACRSLDCVSVFATSVDDAQTVLRLIAGFDPADRYSRVAPPTALQSEKWPAAFRYGVPAGGLEFFGDGDAESQFAETERRLAGLGGTRVAIDFTPFARAGRLLYEGPWIAERLAPFVEFIAKQPQALDPVVRSIMRRGDKVSAVEAFNGLHELAELVREAEDAWRQMDVLVLPTAPTIYRISEVMANPVRLNSNLGIYTNFANLMDLSAIAVPSGFRRDGLPFGITLFGRAFADGRLAGLANQLERSRRSKN